MNQSAAARVALVTGASRGIGRAIAVGLAGAGAHVIVNSTRQSDAAAATCAAIAGAGGTAETAAFDVADADAVQAAVDGIRERHGRCDVLVNNAGITSDGLLLRTKDADWERTLAVNLGGAFHCTKAVARLMVRAHHGRIINLSSVVGSMGNAGQAAYAASKAGLEGFTRSMARELAARDITVNAVAPGFIDTEMVARLPEAVREGYVKLIPVGRLGTVAEVADLVVFLARPESGYITGQVIGINGGIYM